MFKALLFFALTTFLSLNAADQILVFSGSTRTGSLNQQLATIVAHIIKDKGADVTLINLKDYPIAIYDGDLETKEGMPTNAQKIRELMLKSNGIVIVTPEYNGSLPPVLKNVIDWESRTIDGKPSREAYSGKKFAILSASPGIGGGKDAAFHLQFILQRLGGNVVTPIVSVGDANTILEDGKIKDIRIQEEIDKQVEALLAP